MSEPSGALPLLNGVRVVDLTSTLAGPYGTLLLGDLGADVVKVEPPRGDTIRDVGPRVHDDMGAIFLNLNRNKRSVVIDLSTAGGRTNLRRLCDRADVVVHNMRPSAADRCGASAEALRAGHDRLIHCAIRGFGDGPYGDLPAYDDVIQAVSGMAAMQARIAGEPQYVANAVADKVAGMTAAMAIAAALYRRENTGQGCAIEVPMFETVTAFTLLEHLYGHTFVPPKGEACYPRQASPIRRPYRTADGWVAVLVYTNDQWARFLELIGRPDLAKDERFRSLNSRTENINDVIEVVERALASGKSDDWVERLSAIGIPARRYLTVDELFDDPHLAAVGFFHRY
ncbi:MAG TPA: CoA transferase, partial [Acidimicrobiales bacterium]|nr:CoA transferase [Acidimicrobiales bacterium]